MKVDNQRLCRTLPAAGIGPCVFGASASFIGELETEEVALHGGKADEPVPFRPQKRGATQITLNKAAAHARFLVDDCRTGVEVARGWESCVRPASIKSRSASG